VLRKMTERGFLIDNLEGRYDITNLGAILLARDVTAFPSISGKATRIIKYAGRDKSRSEFEQEGRRGYAVSFTGMMKFLMERLPAQERYINGVRRMVPDYPETAICEIIANALARTAMSAHRAISASKGSASSSSSPSSTIRRGDGRLARDRRTGRRRVAPGENPPSSLDRRSPS